MARVTWWLAVLLTWGEWCLRAARWRWQDWQLRLLTGGRMRAIAGGIDVPSEQQIAEKYVRITQGRAADYTAGIQGTAPQEFETAAVAAADSYAQGVQQAIGEGRFAAGLAGSGARWRRKAEQVGAQRFPTGVAAARDDMSAGVAPYVQTLRGLTLDPRRPRGDPANLQRVAAIAAALNQRRRQGGR